MGDFRVSAAHNDAMHITWHDIKWAAGWHLDHLFWPTIAVMFVGAIIR